MAEGVEDASLNACLVNGEMACAIGTVHNFIVKHGEVEGKPKTDRVCWGQFGDSNVGGMH